MGMINSSRIAPGTELQNVSVDSARGFYEVVFTLLILWRYVMEECDLSISMVCAQS